ncbi:MAG TPA: thiamine phosphate synthase [Chthoniobacteraceae bacterium]|jgi:thiamine-phosphate pyrophosphorylase|nr:thiamine phosphate synthase [Chthoniobacteraceae bacterium]
MKRLEDCRLYGILDLGYVSPAEIIHVAARMVEGGVDILQLRAKNFIPDDVRWFAEQIHPVTSEAGVPFVINDFPEVAAEIGAEGVHIGQDDLPVDRAREQAGYRTMIGKSTHSVAQAMAAAAEDVDYLGFGPLYATPTKPTYPPIGTQEIRTVHEMIKKPVFCIGGIHFENLRAVLDAGAQRVVIVSAILKAGDITAYCKKVKDLLA